MFKPLISEEYELKSNRALLNEYSAHAAAKAIRSMRDGEIEVNALQNY